MNKIKTSTFVEFSARALALLTIALVVTVGNASAKEHKPKASGAGSQVVAHIVKQARGSQMRIVPLQQSPRKS